MALDLMYNGAPITATATVLVVENDPADKDAIRRLLGKADCIPIAVDSADMALTMAQANPTFSLVLLSTTLPGTEPVDACRRFKAIPTAAELPILLVAPAQEDEKRVRRALDAGALGCMTKPVDANVLHAWMGAAREIVMLRRRAAEPSGAGAACELEVLQMFAKLSHQVNNPMQGVFATVDLLSFSMAEGSKEREMTEKIIEYAQRAANLVADASKAAKAQLNR